MSEQPAWSLEESGQASKEGWDLFDCGPEDGMQIQRCDELEILPDDAAAWLVVAQGVRRGSTLHTRAYALASEPDVERIRTILNNLS